MKIDDIEKLSKKMEKWHNRIYKWVSIGVFVMFMDVVLIGFWGWWNYRTTVLSLEIEPFVLFTYDIAMVGGGIFILIFILYTILFTTFQFPVRFSGKGRGIKQQPPPTPSGR